MILLVVFDTTEMPMCKLFLNIMKSQETSIEIYGSVIYEPGML